MTEQPMTRLAQPRRSRLRRRIVWAERLLYSAAVLSVVRLVLDHPNGMDVGPLAGWYLLLLVDLALIWLAIRRHKMWACWLLLLFFLLWVSVSVLGDAIESRTIGWIPPDRFAVGLRFGQMLLQGGGLALLFSKRGRRWFTGPSCSNDLP